MPTAFAITSLLVGAPADDQIIRDPGMLAGRTKDDLIGIYLKITTTLKGSAENLTDLGVRVDRSMDMDWGWYHVDGHVAMWDGTRLRIAHVDPVTHREAIIDLVFDPDNEAGSGTFALNRAVRLERPRNHFQPLDKVGLSSIAPERAVWRSPFFGTWKRDGLGGTVIECLHVAVRRNASTVAWLDRADLAGATYGELLTTPDITGDTISFGKGSPAWPNSLAAFTGTLVSHERIDGEWSRHYPLAQSLVKASPSSCASLSQRVISDIPPLLNDATRDPTSGNGRNIRK